MKLNILVVDDDLNQRLIIADLMKDEGHSVYTAAHSNHAAGFFIGNPDLVNIAIVDYDMPPYANGIQVISEAKLISPKTYFILRTSNTDTEVAKQAELLGVVLVSKFLSLEKLRRLIRRAIESISFATVKA